MKREITKISVENSDGVFHFSGKIHFWLDGEKDLEDFKEGLVDFLKQKSYPLYVEHRDIEKGQG